jgi:hypothetical protein
MPRTRRAYPSDANVPHCSEPHDRSSPIRYPVPDTLGQRMQFDRLMRREVIALIGGAATAWPLAARAQQTAVPVIGYLTARSPDADAPFRTAFRKGLSETGWSRRRAALVMSTQARSSQRALVFPDKLQRVANFHASTIRSLIELTAAVGLDYPSEFSPESFRPLQVREVAVRRQARTGQRSRTGRRISNRGFLRSPWTPAASSPRRRQCCAPSPAAARIRSPPWYRQHPTRVHGW